MHDTSGDLDRLISVIGKLAWSPGRATTSGPHFDAPSEPISLDAFGEQEAQLGLQLPLLLRRLYTEVGNGGFGPGHGLLSMLPLSPVDRAIPHYYSRLRASRAKRQEQWPPGIVPFNDWGDLIISCVDLSDATVHDPPVLRFEPNMPASATVAFLHGAPLRAAGLIPERETLSIWFQDWIDGKEMFRAPYKRG